MKYNNPVRPGLREVHRVWEDGDCDLVLSIGTGFQQQLTSPKAPNVRNIFQDGFPARLYRATLSSLSLNGQNSWKDHWYGLEEVTKGQHFRLDLPLTGSVPDIDSIEQMESLQDQVEHHLGDLEGLTRAIKTVSFFFELDEPLTRDGSLYKCRGSILSRSPDSRSLIENLVTEYPYARFETNSGISMGYISRSDLCRTCGRFQKPAAFYVRHPTDVMNLFLVINRLFRRSISGFPNTMGWFEGRQKFNACFGRMDHRARNRQPLDSDCSCIKRRYSQASPTLITGKRPSIADGRRRSKRRRVS
jgi:hypothetical protein